MFACEKAKWKFSTEIKFLLHDNKRPFSVWINMNTELSEDERENK